VSISYPTGVVRSARASILSMSFPPSEASRLGRMETSSRDQWRRRKSPAMSEGDASRIVASEVWVRHGGPRVACRHCMGGAMKVVMHGRHTFEPNLSVKPVDVLPPSRSDRLIVLHVDETRSPRSRLVPRRWPSSHIGEADEVSYNRAM
jgi:hypothetical protein